MNANARISIAIAACLVCLSTVGISHGHGIPSHISVDGSNRLFSASLVNYDHHESELLLTGTGVKGAAGFYPEPGVFPTGAALTVTASGSPQHPLALLYWDGTNVLDSPVDIQLTRTGVNATVLRTDESRAVGTLGAFNGLPGGHSALTLTLPLDAPAGLYGIGFKVVSPGFDQSETFWAIGNYGLSEEEAERGLAAIHTQVPEPGTAALALLAIGTLAAWRTRRRQA